MSALSEVSAVLGSGLKESADRFLTDKQKRTLKIDKKIAVFDRDAALQIDNFRKMFVESAINGTMDEIAAAAHAFSSMINDALFS
ncbi:hypothetical protein FBZ84_12671 [Azospirillum baldaniorum]|uniref:hypothetical protein n=1 Tax=Azospirillum baldaniorum TaxID=1064539 RepID=UPI0011AAF490|nr:hypothetical protein [Azospirillum baldaniorum]TWA55432.1 hypothetical protein FBZ84_12671 [Azospirillum baldaniorum]